MALDKKDKELLDLLYVDSRASFTKLGKKLKLSGSSVERRVNKLRKDGTVARLFADVNLTRLGFRSFRIYLRFDVFDEKTRLEVLRLFEAHKRTIWGVVCEGAYDVLWRIVAKDEVEVEEVLGKMMERFGDKVVEKTIATTTYQTYLSWNRAFGGKRHPELPLERIMKSEELDLVDMKILSSLYGSARATTVEISKLVGLTPDAVSYRIKRLERDEFILGYTAWYDAKKLGFGYYKILINFRSITREKERRFLEFCLHHNNVVFLNKTIGSWDIEVDVIVEDVVELHNFLIEVKTKFGDIMGNHKYVSAIEERMVNPLREYL